MYFPMLVFFVLSGFGEYNKIVRDFFHLIQQPPARILYFNYLAIFSYH